jgi:hypothetical protein
MHLRVVKLSIFVRFSCFTVILCRTLKGWFSTARTLLKVRRSTLAEVKIILTNVFLLKSDGRVAVGPHPVAMRQFIDERV